MLRISNMKLKPKMTAMFLGFGLIPALAILGVIKYSQTQYEADMSKQLLFSARNTSDMIEANMLEYYENTKMFTTVISSLDAEDIAAFLEKNDFTSPINDYMASNAAYRLMMFVDMEGKLIASNTVNAQSAQINTSFLQNMNFSDRQWFKDAVNGNFVDGKNGLTGAAVSEPSQNPLVARIYNNNSFVMSFSAPVESAEGELFGVWVSFVDFSAVEEQIASFYEILKEQGNPSAEITLMDSKGVVLIDYDPTQGKDIHSARDFSVIGQVNLAQQLSVAMKAVKQSAGVEHSIHPHKQVEQIAGYVHTRGNGDYPGTGWSILVRVLPDEFLAVSNLVMYEVMALIALFAAIVVVAGLWLGGRFSAPIRRAENAIQALATGDLSTTIKGTQGADEIASMFDSLLVLQRNLQEQEEANRKAVMNSACLDGLANNVLMTDEDDVLTFTNQASIKNLTKLTDDIRKQFPNFDVSKLLGSSIHMFHKDPENIKRILRGLQPGQQHRAIIELGDLRLSLNAGGIFDLQGNRMGSYAEWRDVTEEQAAKSKKEQIERDVNQVANMISDATKDISQGNLNLSERTEAQAASIEETTATMQQVTERVNDNAKNAEEALEMTAATRDAADKGGSVVKDAIHAMEEISDSSNKINDIISVIDEIAFQTNLLALNAAVEAARAGEQGRGFAVVASEVRTLAGRSATAAREIKDLITESVQKVDVGTRQVNETGECLDGIIMNVQNVDEMVNNISEASQEQAVSISEINKSVSQMDSFTQQNAALVEEAASASKSLEDQALNLVAVINGEEVNIHDAEVRQSTAPMKKQNGVAAEMHKSTKSEEVTSCPVGMPTNGATNGSAEDDGEWLEM